MVERLSILSRVRPQDIGVFVAFLAAVFVFRAPDVYELKPAWRLDLHKTNGSHHRNLLPSPVIADLENDGTNELVVATADAKIKILTFPSEHVGSESILPHLHVKAEHSLVKDGSVLPVAMATGCQEHSSQQDCQHVITVVTSDWTVHCLSNFLKPLWSTTLHKKNQALKPEHFKEVAATVVSRSSGGLVIVGGRASEVQHKNVHNLGHEHEVNDHPTENVEQFANRPRVHHPVKLNKASREAGHFSTYALDSSTGQLRWSHEPGDFESNRTAREKLLSAYHFKLALHREQHHTGEVHWKQYQASLLRTLPLRWTHPSDTTLKTAHFWKGATRTASRNKPELTPKWLGLESLNLDFIKSKGDSNEREEKFEHNAIVIRSHQGLEVLKLQSGQPMCRYVLAQEGTTVGDINGDATLDHARAHFRAQQDVPSELPSCSAVITSESRVLFTGPICSSNSMFSGYLDVTEDDPADQDYEPLPVAPLIIPSAPHRRGIFRHLMGHNLRDRSQAGMDVIFLVSTGKLTSYGPHGEENWQVKVDGAWKKHVRQDDHGQWTSQGDGHFFPSLQQVQVQAGGGNDESVVLVSGWHHLSLVSLIDGTILASHTLPCQPVAPVVAGDFTNDGMTDFVVQCSESYLGFSLDRRPGYLWTAVWLVCGLLVALMALGIMRFVEEELVY